MKIILLSDSHHSLDERIFPHLEECDEIWHAGDIGNLKVTDKLKTFAPIRAVWGNIDDYKARKEFRKTTYFKCQKLKVMMTHIGGYPGRYEKGIKKMLEAKKPDLFISGHSHILKSTALPMQSSLVFNVSIDQFLRNVLEDIIYKI